MEETLEKNTETMEKKKSKNSKNLQPEMDKLKLENAELNDKLLRISAEMQNMKRRSSEEMSRMLRYDGEDFIKRILPVIDNLERAISLDDANLEDEMSKFLSGFKMIYGNLVHILEDYEVKEIKSLNEAFDPTFMEAVLTDHEEGKAENIVLDVLQKGYTYKDKVIRPSMVKVNN